MRGEPSGQEGLLSYLSPEALVPPTHPLRALKRRADAALATLSPTWGPWPCLGATWPCLGAHGPAWGPGLAIQHLREKNAGGMCRKRCGEPPGTRTQGPRLKRATDNKEDQ